MRKMMFSTLFILMIMNQVMGGVDARMLHEPDVSATHITFVYAGDIWIVAKKGGIAHRISSPKGEESFPRFSPDGKHIAFSANYDGNRDIYVVPATGGDVHRLTYHPSNDRMVNWSPDGKKILFASVRKSGINRFHQLYIISKKGGIAEKLPVPYGDFGSLSPDQRTIAYMPISRIFRTWKRYRGGGASDIWLFDLKDLSARKLTDHIAIDGHPMWHKEYIYFLSDRGKNQRQNIWNYHTKTKKFTQVTFFKDFDITYPAIGPMDIVFEAGGKLYLLDLETDKFKDVKIEIISDFATLKPYRTDVSQQITTATVSPDGKRVIFSARGELFSVPAKHGYIKNLTQSSGVFELYPQWSPDAKHVAYWSDRDGEYDLKIKRADGKGKEIKLTQLGPGFRYQPQWSPNSQMIAFIDNQNYMKIYDLKKKTLQTIDRQLSLRHPHLENFSMNWSSDNRWIAYHKQMDNFQSAIFIFSVKDSKSRQVTSGFYNDYSPVFDPAGKYLYFLSKRSFQAVYSSIDRTWVYPNTTQIMAVTLKKSTPSPTAARNDEVLESEKNGEKKEKTPEKTIDIDFDSFEQRGVTLPIKAGRFANLGAVEGKVIYGVLPNSGSKERDSSIQYYDLKKRKEQTILKKGGYFVITADGKKLLVSLKKLYYIVDIRPNQKLSDKINTRGMYMTIHPRAEWSQLFSDTWRRFRDFFYDPNMHGLDWEKTKTKYSKLLKQAVTRWDVNTVIGNLIGEVNASHTFVGGGDTEKSKSEKTGLLGIDWELSKGAYRIKHIINGAPWDSEVRSPLAQPGVNINAGDYILAVNGVPIDTDKEPHAAFQGLANTVVALTVNNQPSISGSREILVQTLSSEIRLRNLEWINNNRQWVNRFSKGKVGYIYMPNTSHSGQRELIRQYYGQLNKKAFIIDERFNSGGQLADRFIELLNRKTAHFISRRNGPSWRSIYMANNGPKVMLTNGMSFSGGDAFPYSFKIFKVGPIVGTRSAGGLIGPSTGHRLMDGGYITIPGGRIYGHDGKWFPEGWGVEPDIKVIDDHGMLAKGVDPQLKAGVMEALRLLKENPPKDVPPPAFENRSSTEKK